MYIDTQKESGTPQSRTVQQFVQISVLDEEATVWNKYKTDEFVMNRLPLQLVNYLRTKYPTRGDITVTHSGAVPMTRPAM